MNKVEKDILINNILKKYELKREEIENKYIEKRDKIRKSEATVNYFLDLVNNIVDIIV